VFNDQYRRKAVKLPKISFLSEHSDCNYKSFDAVLKNFTEEESSKTNYKESSKQDIESISNVNDRKYKDNLNLKYFGSISNHKNNNLDEINHNKEPHKSKMKSSEFPRKQSFTNSNILNNLLENKKYISDIPTNKRHLDNKFNNIKKANWKSPIRLVNHNLFVIEQKHSPSLINNKKLLANNPFDNEGGGSKLYSNKNQSYDNYNQPNLFNEELYSPILKVKFLTNKNENNCEKKIVYDEKSVLCLENKLSNNLNNKSRNSQNRPLIDPHPNKLFSQANNHERANSNIPSIKMHKTIDINHKIHLKITTSQKAHNIKTKNNFCLKSNAHDRNSLDSDSLNLTKSINFQMNKINDKPKNALNETNNMANNISKENLPLAENIDGIKIVNKINRINNTTNNKPKNYGFAEINDSVKNKNIDIEKYL